jgi:hypothetical protein
VKVSTCAPIRTAGNGRHQGTPDSTRSGRRTPPRRIAITRSRHAPRPTSHWFPASKQTVSPGELGLSNKRPIAPGGGERPGTDMTAFIVEQQPTRRSLSRTIPRSNTLAYRHRPLHADAPSLRTPAVRAASADLSNQRGHPRHPSFIHSTPRANDVFQFRDGGSETSEHTPMNRFRSGRSKNYDRRWNDDQTAAGLPGLIDRTLL